MAHVSPQQTALSELFRVWNERTTTGHRDLPEYSARELACRFRSCLQSEPALVGWNISRQWVQANYPAFCRAMNAEPVPYKDFACELKDVMPKKRINDRKDGKRVGTETFYLVQHPTSNVVEMAGRKRA